MLQGAYSMHSAAEKDKSGHETCRKRLYKSLLTSNETTNSKTRPWHFSEWLCLCKDRALSFNVSLEKSRLREDPCLNCCFSPPDDHIHGGTSFPIPSQIHECALIATLEIKCKTCWWATRPMGCERDRQSRARPLTLGAKLPWELSPVEWRDLFHFTAERSALPGRPLPASLIHQLCCASLKQSLPAASTH